MISESYRNQLERAEDTLRKNLAAIYAGAADDMATQINSLYGQLSEINYANADQPASSTTKANLAARRQELMTTYIEFAEYLPAAELISDLSLLGAAVYSIALTDFETACLEAQAISEHLIDQAERARTDVLAFWASLLPTTLMGTLTAVAGGILLFDIIFVRYGEENLSFIDRVFRNHATDRRQINALLEQGVTMGRDLTSVRRDIVDRYNRISMRDSNRILFTEGTRVFNEIDAEITEYYFDRYYTVTVGDDKVCPICSAMAAAQEQNPILLSEREVGINFPQYHPHCRCTINVEVEEVRSVINNA